MVFITFTGMEKKNFGVLEFTELRNGNYKLVDTSTGKVIKRGGVTVFRQYKNGLIRVNADNGDTVLRPDGSCLFGECIKWFSSFRTIHGGQWFEIGVDSPKGVYSADGKFFKGLSVKTDFVGDEAKRLIVSNSKGEANVLYPNGKFLFPKKWAPDIGSLMEHWGDWWCKYDRPSIGEWDRYKKVFFTFKEKIAKELDVFTWRWRLVDSYFYQNRGRGNYKEIRECGSSKYLMVTYSNGCKNIIDFSGKKILPKNEDFINVDRHFVTCGWDYRYIFVLATGQIIDSKSLVGIPSLKVKTTVKGRYAYFQVPLGKDKYFGEDDKYWVFDKDGTELLKCVDRAKVDFFWEMMKNTK